MTGAMLTALKAHLYKDFRRLSFVTALAFASGVLFYLKHPAVVAGFPLPVITGVIYALVVGTAALLVCIFLPKLRFMVDCIALSRFGIAILALAFPDLGQFLLKSPLLMAFVVVTTGGAISRLLYGGHSKDETAPQAYSTAVKSRSILWQRRVTDWIEGPKPKAARPLRGAFSA